MFLSNHQAHLQIPQMPKAKLENGEITQEEYNALIAEKGSNDAKLDELLAASETSPDNQHLARKTSKINKEFCNTLT